MAKWDFKGLDDYIGELTKLEDTREAIGPTVYAGAKVVADAVKTALEGLPVDDRRKVEMRTGITHLQKQGLIDGFGVASMRNDKGFINVKLGFEGYNRQVTKAYPNGQPNLMIARSIESGTSFLPRMAVISKAVTDSKQKCEEVMREEFDKFIEKVKEK